MGEPAPEVRVREVTVDVVRPVRHRVLRAGWPEASVRTPLDESPTTWHLAALAGEGAVGVVTLFPDTYGPRSAQRSERFRWMAVLPEWQGRGIGRLLMRRAAELALDRGAALLWAHGRDSAQRFYEGLGFVVEGDGFVDPETGIGHHFVVIEAAALLA